jgi:hypothetical protein
MRGASYSAAGDSPLRYSTVHQMRLRGLAFLTSPSHRIAAAAERRAQAEQHCVGSNQQPLRPRRWRKEVLASALWVVNGSAHYHHAGDGRPRLSAGTTRPAPDTGLVGVRQVTGDDIVDLDYQSGGRSGCAVNALEV